MERTRTLIVADYAPVRAGLGALLAAEGSVRLVGEATRASLEHTLLTSRLDAVLLDATGSGPDAIPGVLEALKRRFPPPALVVIGDLPSRDVPSLLEADFLPGWGYLQREKGDGAAALAAAIRAAALGSVVLDRHLRMGSCAPPPGAPDSGAAALTQREREVLELLARGLPNKQIAARLGVAPHTAKFHVAQILAKLEAASRTEAVTQAARRGLITL